MGKTYKKNDRWKKDRRDQNFKKSKKFKEIQHGDYGHPKKHNEPEKVEQEDDVII